MRERYPSFLDAIRDMDDALSMVNLFASLPAAKEHGIPDASTALARRLALEFQAYVVRTHELRKVFISVKGIYFQAEILGTPVTWVAPHQLAQVLPEVDYRIMLTFLDFYLTMLKFINFKLFHGAGLLYPPPLDDQLDRTAAGIEALMRSIAAQGTASGPRATREAGKCENQDEDDDIDEDGSEEEMKARRARLAKLGSSRKALEKIAAGGEAHDDDDEEEEEEEDDDDDDEDEDRDLASIDSGDHEEEEGDEDEDEDDEEKRQLRAERDARVAAVAAAADEVTPGGESLTLILILTHHRTLTLTVCIHIYTTFTRTCYHPTTTPDAYGNPDPNRTTFYI